MLSHTMTVHDEPTANGDATFDPTDRDTQAGILASLDSEVKKMRAEQIRQGKLIDKIANALGIHPGTSEPSEPPEP